MKRVFIIPEKENLRLIFKILSDDTSCQILNYLRKQEEGSYPKQISEDLEIPLTTVWKKIRDAKNANLINSKAIDVYGRKVVLHNFTNLAIAFSNKKICVGEILNKL